MTNRTGSTSSSAAPLRTRQDRKPLTFRGTQTFATVETGDGDNIPHESFTVHKALLCHHSGFFRAAPEGSFEEGRTQVVKLDDVEGEIFGIIVDWMYTKDFQTKEAGVVPTVDMCKLWVLAGRLLMSTLQNKTIDEFCSSKKVPKGEGDSTEAMREALEFVYATDAEHTILKQFLIDSITKASINTTLGSKASQRVVNGTLGQGPAVDFIHALIKQLIAKGIELEPLVTVKDLYYVKED